MKIHLVDGTYELFRSHFGAPPRTAPDGRQVGATHGLVQTLLLLLRQDDVTHVACAFDHVVESFRNDMLSGYKTGEGVLEELFAQFDLAERAASSLGIVIWPMVEFEADDVIATAAEKWAECEGVEQVVICAPDRDLMQVVKDDQVVSHRLSRMGTNARPGGRPGRGSRRVYRPIAKPAYPITGPQ